jgi:two-component system copper resistance phosphate regulon response regulator CusR
MKTQSDATASAGLKILLVDDVPQGTIARKSILKGLGYAIETAENGVDALELMAAHSFALMVTDYKMPGMDGLELIVHARARYPSMRIILLSAIADTMGFTEEFSGADAVIPKSGTELSELTRTIKKLLAKKPARKPVASQKKPAAFMVKSS